MSDIDLDTKYRLTVCIEAVDYLDGREANTEIVSTLNVMNVGGEHHEFKDFVEAKEAALRLAGNQTEVADGRTDNGD